MAKTNAAQRQTDKAPDDDVPVNDNDARIAALEQRVGTLTGALMQLVGPLMQLKKLNSIPTDAVHKAARNVEAMLQQ